jgi:hypothetical protein
MGLNSFSLFIRNVKNLEASHDKHVQSFEQLQFINDDEGQVLVDFIGRFENLQSDFSLVDERLGLHEKILPDNYKSKKKALLFLLL